MKDGLCRFCGIMCLFEFICCGPTAAILYVANMGPLFDSLDLDLQKRIVVNWPKVWFWSGCSWAKDEGAPFSYINADSGHQTVWLATVTNNSKPLMHVMNDNSCVKRKVRKNKTSFRCDPSEKYNIFASWGMNIKENPRRNLNFRGWTSTWWMRMASNLTGQRKNTYHRVTLTGLLESFESISLVALLH